ncbi:MAG: metallophosphoesterase [Phycisphaerae bacterium]|nr:metallophosphoesterase [Phycisphaerae bacterium]
MKLLYCSDLHGDEDQYARLVSLAGQQCPDVVVLGGDMLPDDSALKPQRMGHGQPEFVRRQFKASIAALRDACDCKAVLVVFGNHDWESSVVAMEELADGGLVTILNLEDPVRIDGLSFVGYSYTPPTPWYVKDFERLDQPGDRPPLLGGGRWDSRFSKAVSHGAERLFGNAPTIADDLATLRPPPAPWVFVAHAPPFETHLDRTHGDVPWGSRAVLDAIRKHHPMLSLHGHVHESPSVSGEYRHDIQGTVAINAGQQRRRLNYAVIHIDVAGCKVTQVEHGQRS